MRVMRVMRVSMRVVLAAVFVALAVLPLSAPSVRADDAPTLIAVETDLQLGEATEFTLVYEDESFQGFKVTVPSSAKALHIHTYGCTSGVELYLFLDRPIGSREWDAATYEAATGRFDERLAIDRNSRPRLRAGTYYVYVMSYYEDDEITGTIVATLDDPPPVPSVAKPPYRAMSGLKPLERAFDATVRVDGDLGGGSGSVLTPNGYVLTNLHVLYDDETDSLQADDIYLSFSDDYRRPPRQTHIAELVEYDELLDLALLLITHTIEGAEVSSSLKLTWMQLGDPSKLEFDEALRVIGFPAVGGERDLSSLTLTRGIVSGFSYEDDTMSWIKTDCVINSGNSGGAAVNAEGELIGVPSMTIEDESDVLGYVRPVSAMPAAWRETIKKNLK